MLKAGGPPSTPGGTPSTLCSTGRARPEEPRFPRTRTTLPAQAALLPSWPTRAGLGVRPTVRWMRLSLEGDRTDQYMYCLTLPVEVEGVTPDSDHQLGVDVSETCYGAPRNGSRVPPDSDHGAPRNGAQHIKELGKERRTSTPAGPVDDGDESSPYLSLDVLEKDVKANLEPLAGLLGVALGEIKDPGSRCPARSAQPPFWRSLLRLGDPGHLPRGRSGLAALAFRKEPGRRMVNDLTRNLKDA